MDDLELQHPAVCFFFLGETSQLFQSFRVTARLTRQRRQMLAQRRDGRREDPAQIGDDGQRERNANQREEHAERPAAGRHRYDVTITCSRLKLVQSTPTTIGHPQVRLTDRRQHGGREEHCLQDAPLLHDDRELLVGGQYQTALYGTLCYLTLGHIYLNSRIAAAEAIISK